MFAIKRMSRIACCEYTVITVVIGKADPAELVSALTAYFSC